jgi:hypothetical protein
VQQYPIAARDPPRADLLVDGAGDAAAHDRDAAVDFEARQRQENRGIAPRYHAARIA